eukprot:Gb_02373 [translate_table: standard]
MLSMELAPPLHSPSQDHTNHIHDIHSCIAFTLRTRSAALKDQSKLSIQVKAETINKNTNTFASLLQACTNVRQLGQFHAHMLLTGLNQNIKVVTTLVSMYAMLGNMDTARLVFEKIYRRDVFLWNTMIGEYARSGLYEEALGLYYEMQAAGIEPDKFTFRFVLTACAGLSALQEGKEIHDHIIQSGFKSDVFVWTALINMYAKCGSTDIACYLFDKMPERNVVSWNAMISGYAQNGQADEALNLFHEMQLADIKPISVTMVSVLSACAHLGALQEGKWIHNCIIRRGFASDTFVGTALVDMYSKCGDIETARRVFDRMSKRNVVSWNAMVAGYSRNGNGTEALALFNQMQLEGVKPNLVTVVCVVPAYAHLEALQQVKCIQSYIIKSGFESDIFVTNSLLAIYAKCGRVELAHQLFVEMSKLHVTSWNTMIAGFSQNGYGSEALALFNQMQLVDLKPDSLTMVSVLPACAHLTTLQQGKSIHGYIIKSGFESDVVLQTALIDMYAKCRSIEIARQVFVKMPKRNVVSWNAMIDGYVQEGHANEGLMLFNQMLLTDMKPDSATIVSVLPACAHLTTLQEVKWIHGYIIRIGFESDVVIQTSLIDMYAKCNSIEIAHRLFDKMPQRNVVSWNAMIGGFFQNGHPNEALTLFNQMILTNIKPDSTTMVSILQVCADLGALQQGKCIHDYIIKNGFESDVFVGNSLIAMYANCGSVDNAYQLFHKMSKRDVVSWTMMIAGYSQSGYANEALKLFNQMQVTGIKPDSITIVKVLPTCVQLATLQQGECIHGYAIRSGFESDIFVGTALIDMYAKCGSLKTARHVFDKMSKRNIASWNAMISGYGIHGNCDDALALYLQMQESNIKPNDITFVCVLSACSHAGLVDEGRKYFACMSQDYYITPRMEHYACIVDLLGRAGCLDEAQDFIQNMPLEPGSSVWGALLGACRIHCNIELGELVAERIFDLEPDNAGYYVLLSNIYAAAGRWDGVAKVRTMMKDRGLKKTPGCSLIEVNNRVHAFLVGDRSHPQSELIYETLDLLYGQMKEGGYVPNTKFALHDGE